MRGGSVTASPDGPTGDPTAWWRRAPWWLQALAVAAAGRLVGAVVLAVVARTQAATGWTAASPSYLEYAGLMWDASWYRGIAEQGYPVGLPTGPDGRVVQNAWAFFPLFPLLVRVPLAAGVPWHVAAPVVATGLGLAAAVVVHRVVRLTGASERVALTTVALVQAHAAAPVLQVAYTESLALLLVAACLWAVMTRRYLLAVPLVVALGLTRAVALPLALVVVVHAAHRWRTRAADPWPTRERVGLAALGAVSVVAGLLWPAMVGLATGVPDAYAQTQAAWRGRQEVVPLVPWFDVGRWLVGSWGPVLVVLVWIAVLGVVVARPLRRLGPEPWAWTAAYLGYLVVVLEPGTSLVRFTLLAFPVAAAAAALLDRLPTTARRAALAAVLTAGVLAQVAWVALLWRLVPPSGWPP
ncbi:hypothetical protein [Cellulomonas carbonis]|uniref:Integral membrane protein n=1 Tax=Cellulomonas carbonis T26 TaxID=947969 RepID=A0A0A0BVK2_9CELL|nr:hypothetical protein [Cellulomonas carbonis]KGM12423.1 integral membrane protein [Cellulomonas carbonis T26]GGC15162.1 hypothetical protein GCM10010972_30540 [Cellulomonas carbonis]